MRTYVAIWLTMWFGFAAAAEPDRLADVVVKPIAETIQDSVTRASSTPTERRRN
jgi:hypothetical protein